MTYVFHRAITLLLALCETCSEDTDFYRDASIIDNTYSVFSDDDEEIWPFAKLPLRLLFGRIWGQVKEIRGQPAGEMRHIPELYKIILCAKN